MARPRKEKSAKDIELKQPDRSGPEPGQKTLLEIAQERQLFQQADARQTANKKVVMTQSGPVDEDDMLSPGAERFLEAVLWTSTLAMLHFSFEVLVQNQYGTEIVWPTAFQRSAAAWAVFLILFYPLHPHAASPRLVPLVPLKYQKAIRQAIFFSMSIVSGCYLIYISNTYSYLKVMKQAPPLGCLWVWAVIEMDLAWAAASLAVAGVYLWQNGYSIK